MPNSISHSSCCTCCVATSVSSICNGTSPPRPRLATVNQRDAFPSYDEDRVGSSAIRLLAHFDKFAKISSPRFPLPQHIRWELLSWYSSWTYACVPAADTGSG